MTDLLKKIIKARVSLLRRAPFFGELALRLQAEVTQQVPTAATDGKRILFNPEFTNSLSSDHLQGLIAHEVMHAALGHIWRRGGRQPLKWNIACDFAVNGELLACGFALPSGALVSSQFTGMPTEWIYARLPRMLDPLPMQDLLCDGDGDGDSGDGNVGGDGDGDAKKGKGGNTTGEQESAAAEWRAAAAAVAQRYKGKIPGSLSRLIGQAALPKCDWRALLWRFVEQLARADYSWTRPSTRYLAQDLYLPSLRSKRMPPIAIAVDTSGSIGDHELAKFQAEIRAIQSSVQPESILVAYVDAALHSVEEFGPDEPVVLHPKGGGGTDFRPAFKWFEEQEEAACLVYLTDLYGSFPDRAPERPVLWATIVRQDVPFGEVVTLED